MSTHPESSERSALIPSSDAANLGTIAYGFQSAPKFTKYNGTGNPKTHLRMFANKLGKPVDDENLPVRLFPESLEGDALDWYSNLKPEEMRTWLDLSTAFVRQYEYNCELAPTRTTLEGTKRKPSEDHKTYAKRWRKLAAKVEPPMTEEEIVHTGVPAGYDPQVICAYHSGSPGHSTINCWALKYKIQDMIDAGDIVLRRRGESGPNVSNNPLPEHKGTVGAITTEEQFEEPGQYIVDENEVIGIIEKPFVLEEGIEPALLIEDVEVSKEEGVTVAKFEEIVKENLMPSKPSVTEKEALAFLKLLKRSEFNVVGQLDKMPAQVSILDLLLTSEVHRDTLLKVLKEAQVSKNIPVDKFAHVMENVLAANYITFSDEDLTSEGIGHNKALYISVRCNGKLLPRVLIDNGSALNICPRNTLIKLGLSDARLRISATIIRGFDGAKREPMGEVDLVLEIGPAQFKVKFIINDQLITVFAEDDCTMIVNSGSNGESSRKVLTSDHRVVDIVSVGWICGIDAPEASVMMAKKMIRGEIFGKKDTFGLGFQPTARDKKEMQARKKAEKEGKQIAMSIPPLRYTFPRSSGVILSELDEESPIEEIEMDLSQLWPKIKSFDPSDITILEFNDRLLDISHEFDILESEIQNESDSEEESESFSKILEQYEEKPKPNLEETEIINIGTKTEVKKIKISVHLNKGQRKEMIKFLTMFQDVFAWSYDDMPGISTDIVVHRLPTDPNFLPIKQKPRKFKPDMSLKIKEQIEKQLNARIIMKSEEVRVCVDYRDLNKASPKDDFPSPNIHILLDNTAGHEIESFADCFAGYHQILVADEDREKTVFITPWGTFCYRVMPFGLKNAGATYQRAMTTLFHDMIHKEMEVYVDDIIIKSKKTEDHLVDLKKLFERLRKYDLKLNPAKCALEIPPENC
ncbi:uncharacterized protein [Coffea arabica]|uniref:Reverse transcriptase domain-containing protein n=1 Tax=Coffea arabica TaxID=13443 RepID=A0ABM4W2P9_COFAR